MTDDDVDSWISNVGHSAGTVSEEEFLHVFASMSKKMPDTDFKHMIVDLSA
jgi:Ca2+-binding EF-hand superfamily protein